MRIPVALNVEFRGVKPQREYTVRETGELKTAQAVLKFEQELDNGDVEMIEVAASTFDRMSPPIDYSRFERGGRYRLDGVAVLQDRGSDYDSYLSIASCVPAKPAATRSAA